MLEIIDLHYEYSRRVVFRGASLVARPGEITVILGRSGSGKSTLFRVVAGFLPCKKGVVLWNQRRVSRGDVAYIQQKEPLLPWLSALDNICIGTILGKRSRRKSVPMQRLQEVVDRFQLHSLLDAYPDELSGGQRQRVALAALWLSTKPLLLLDEPFSSLDMLTKELLYKEILSMTKQYKKTVVLVTHDPNDVRILGDKVFVLKDHQLTPFTFHRHRNTDSWINEVKYLLSGDSYFD